MFDALGRQLPPWRAYPATLGRWLSSACVDMPVPCPASVPGTAPALGAFRATTAAAVVPPSLVAPEAATTTTTAAAAVQQQQIRRFLSGARTGVSGSQRAVLIEDACGGTAAGAAGVAGAAAPSRDPKAAPLAPGTGAAATAAGVAGPALGGPVVIVGFRLMERSD